MDLNFIRLLIDFGLMIVIWMIQLIVYPSFLHADAGKFVSWHRQYTGRISLFVIPLMFAQIGAYLHLILTDFSPLVLVPALLILFNWLITFMRFVSLHARLGEKWDKEIAANMVKFNWYRTAAWSSIFLISMLI